MLAAGFGRFAGVVVTPLQHQFIRAGLGRGMSANVMQLELRRADIGLRRQAVLDVAREIRGAKERAGGFGSVRQAFKPGASLYEPTKIELRRKYRVEVLFKDASGTLPQDRPIVSVVSSDELLTRQQIEDAAYEIAKPLIQKYELDRADFKVGFALAYRRD